MPSHSPPFRLWPAAAILGLAAVALIWTWRAEFDNAQMQTITAGAIVIVTAPLLLLWWLFFSRLTWKVRLAGLLAVILGVAAARTLFRFEGFSGDLVPRLSWRWSARPDLPVEAGPNRQKTGAFDDREGDYPQFLGPNRNATLPDPGLITDWESHPPFQLWRQPVGAGWSSFAVAGDSAITQELRGDQEVVVSYRLQTGAVQWMHSDAGFYSDRLAGEGPRATPTVIEGKVYTLGSKGLLSCLDFFSGKLLWQRDVEEDHQLKGLIYGRASSPLVNGFAVIVTAGGPGSALVAYHMESGELLWSAGSDQVVHTSPVMATIHGRQQILMLYGETLVGHDPGDGSVLWRHPRPAKSPVAAQPLQISEELIFASSGYGVGGTMVRVRLDDRGGWESQTVWETIRLKSKFANMVYHDAFIYGLDDGILVCLDPKDGQRRWKRGRYGHGQIILAGNLLLIQAESGEVALVEATPRQFNELTRFEALSSKTWNHPVLAGNILLLRNAKEAAAFELPTR
ncbi:MAG: PQQ-binding-like beta-propeller repeat protein [Acidobacteriota bacterium]